MKNKLRLCSKTSFFITALCSNAITSGMLLMGKEFIFASPNTVLNAIQENKFRAFCSVAKIPIACFAISGVVTSLAYFGYLDTNWLLKCSLKSIKKDQKDIDICEGDVNESMKFMFNLVKDYPKISVALSSAILLLQIRNCYYNSQSGFITNNIFTPTIKQFTIMSQPVFHTKTASLCSILMLIAFTANVVSISNKIIGILDSKKVPQIIPTHNTKPQQMEI